MKINAVSLRVGNVINMNQKLWRVVKTEHVKPGKGGAFAQVELKGVLDHTKKNERFRSEASVELVRLDEAHAQYTYDDGSMLHFMHTETYEDMLVPTNLLTTLQSKFLTENMQVTLSLYDEQIISIALPDKVTVPIAEADMVVKGQTASASYKPAKLDNGQSILVPPFIQAGDKVVVDTNTGEYVERIKK